MQMDLFSIEAAPVNVEVRTLAELFPSEAAQPVLVANETALTSTALKLDLGSLGGVPLTAFQRSILEKLDFPTPNSARITSQLSPEDYKKADAVLKGIHGKWTGGKTQAHVFPFNPQPLIDAMLESGLGLKKSALDYFPTPKELVDSILDIDDVAHRLTMLAESDDCHLLEPSAGRGAFLSAVLERVGPNFAGSIDAVEFNPLNGLYLRELPVTTHQDDFLNWEAPAGRKYSLILMNPPFTAPKDPDAYIAHIRHAASMLAPDGCLVAIAPDSLLSRDSDKVQEFRDWACEHGTIERIERGAFAASGTNVGTALLILQPESNVADEWTGYANRHTMDVAFAITGSSEGYSAVSPVVAQIRGGNASNTDLIQIIVRLARTLDRVSVRALDMPALIQEALDLCGE